MRTNKVEKKKIFFVILLATIITMIYSISVYAYEKIYQLESEEDIYNDIASTKNGGYVTVGSKIDKSATYISLYNSEGNEIKSKEYGRSLDYFYSVKQTMDNGYIAVGQSQANYSDALIVKFDEDLNITWEKTYKGNKYESYTSVIETSDGSFIAVGITDKVNTNYEPSKGLIAKYSQNGEQLWINTIGGTSYDKFNSVIETSDNGYIVVGEFKSKDIDSLEIKGESDAIIFKYDNEGKLLWKKNYGGSDADGFASIIETKDEGYVIVGNTYSSDIEGISKYGQEKCLIVKYDKDFNLLWNKSYGKVGYNYFTDIAELNNGNVIAIGRNNLYKYNQDGEIISGKNNGGVIVQYDINGNMITDEVSNQDYDVEYSAISKLDDTFVILGTGYGETEESNYDEITSIVIKYKDDTKLEQIGNEESKEETVSQEDNTIANKILPKAGQKNIVIILMLSIILVLATFILYKKLKHIK